MTLESYKSAATADHGSYYKPRQWDGLQIVFISYRPTQGIERKYNEMQ